jgi:hypothetical protein
MPQPSIRPDVVVVFTDVDWDGHLDDPQRPYHRDGRPFTHAEHALLGTITPAEQPPGWHSCGVRPTGCATSTRSGKSSSTWS